MIKSLHDARQAIRKNLTYSVGSINIIIPVVDYINAGMTEATIVSIVKDIYDPLYSNFKLRCSMSSFSSICVTIYSKDFDGFWMITEAIKQELDNKFFEMMEQNNVTI